MNKFFSKRTVSFLAVALVATALPLSFTGGASASDVGAEASFTSAEVLEAVEAEVVESLELPRVEGQILVTYNKGYNSGSSDTHSGVVSEEDKSVVRGLPGVSLIEELGDEVDLLAVSEGRVADVLVEIKLLPQVLDAEPDTLVDIVGRDEFEFRVLEGESAARFAGETVTTSESFSENEIGAASLNDPGLRDPDLWSLHGPLPIGLMPASPYGSNASEAWYNGYFSQTDVVVAVLDSGVQINHPDLAANIWKNPREVVNGKDSDGNGLIDDVNGWNFYDNNRFLYKNVSEDSHGTHVAGTIAAVGNNGIGVAGIAPNAKILPVKFIGKDGGSSSDAIKAINYVVNLKKAGAPITAINASWGGPGESSAVTNAIVNAGNENIIFIAAAGNSSLPNAFYPARSVCMTKWGVDCIISVGANTPFGGLSWFSNYNATNVDILAPGSDIVSTYPEGLYAYQDGTSMAAPHVAGAVALCRGLQEDYSMANKVSSLLQTAVRVPGWGSYAATGGHLDVNAVAGACGPARLPKMDHLSPVTMLEGQESAITLTPHGQLKTGTWSLGVNSQITSISQSGVLRHTPAKYGSYSLNVSLRNSQNVTTSTSIPVVVKVFNDVPSGSFYEQSTHWLRREGITNGVSATNYGSGDNVTRAQMAAFLWRAAGEPPAANHVFRDEARIPVFARTATDWLYRNGITTNDPFNPNGDVTRAQMSAFLWRAAGSPAAPNHVFRDEAAIPGFARQATDWMYAQGITTNDPFDPNGKVTRAQMSAFLWRAAGSPN